MIAERLRWAWWGLTGHAQRLHIERCNEIARAHHAASEAYDLRRQLDFAKGGIEQLKALLSKDYEERQRAESDKISQEIIARLKEGKQ